MFKSYVQSILSAKIEHLHVAIVYMTKQLTLENVTEQHVGVYLCLAG